MQQSRSFTRLLQLVAVLTLAALIASCGPIADTPTPVANPTASLPQALPTTLPATATVPGEQPAATATAPLPGPDSTVGATAAPTDATTSGEPVATQPAALDTATPTVAAPAATATTPAVAATATVPAVAATATAPEAAASATPAAAGANGERIVYLDPDGVTIKAIDPHGGDAQPVITVTLAASQTVGGLSVNRTGEFVLYGLSDGPGFFATHYSLLSGGTVKALDQPFAYPRWSPDGTRFVAQALDSSGALGPIYIYDAVRDNGGVLPFNGSPDWFPDGERIIYAAGANLHFYNLTSGDSGQLTNLPDDDSNRWVIQSAHVLPDGNTIVFYGGQETVNGVKQFGPHGEGEAWWTLPLTGGDPQPWAASQGNGVIGFTASRQSGRGAYVESAWAGALCSNEQKVAVVNFADAALPVLYSPATGLNAEGTQTTIVQGISWSPAGDALAFAVEADNCTPDGPQAAGPPTIYVWTIESPTAGDAQARRLVTGLYPQWVAATTR